MNKRATKHKSATENYKLKFLTVSSVSSDSIVKGIIDDIVNTAVKTAEVDEQKAIFSEVESTTVQRKYANTHHFQK